MTSQRQIVFWVATLTAALFFFWYLQDILLPFIAGFVLAYFLDPVADRLVRAGLPRLAASSVIIVSAVLILVLAFVLVVPAMANQAAILVNEIPQLSAQLVQLANEFAPQWLKDMVANNGGDLQSTLADYGGKIAVWLAGFAATLWTGSKALLNVVSLLLITPVVAFYLLNDWDHLVARIDYWLPRDHQFALRIIATDIDVTLAGYIRGQGAVCLIMAAFYAAGYTLVGLKSGLAIGLMTGLLAFIPFFGAVLGGAAALVVGFLQFWPIEVSLLWVLGVLVIGQFIEGNFLSPRLVGHSIGLHPVFMMLALLGFSYVFGFLGLLLAVPLAATTGVLVRHGLTRYLNSGIYRGQAATQDDG